MGDDQSAGWPTQARANGRSGLLGVLDLISGTGGWSRASRDAQDEVVTTDLELVAD